MLLALAVGPASATVRVAGVVRDRVGQSLPGARVAAAGGPSTRTDEHGAYRLDLVPGRHELTAGLAGHAEAVRTVAAEGDVDDVDFVLEPLVALAEDVVVHALRARDRTPVTKTDLAGEALDARSWGQETTFLLTATPSVTAYSESGLALGSGYSYFSVRGVDQRRINMTFDGVPLNDPEESAVYFANFGDFASVVSSVQVQRGVGTSAVGSPSYGGSVNFAGVDMSETAGGGVDLGYGSYDTSRMSAFWQSGRLDNGVALYARASQVTTDGYRRDSGVEQRTVFAGASWQGRKTSVRMFGFTGDEDTDLAFLAVEPEILETDPQYNPMRPEEDDSFGQDLVYVQVAHVVSPRLLIGAQAYYNGAQGWLDLFDDPVAGGPMTRYGLDGRTLGGQLSLTLERDRWSIAAGLHGYDFSRDHYADQDDDRLYLNTGTKREISGFVKGTYEVGRTVSLFGDVQARAARYRYDGDVDPAPVEWTFLNPRIGVRWDPTERTGLYASVGRAGREPTRNDMLGGADNLEEPVDLGAVRAESVVDFEIGADLRGPRWAATLNAFAMEFDDEIAATGEQSDLGYAIRTNLDSSHRRGVELDLAVQPNESWRVSAHATLAESRIRTWPQALDVYDADGAYRETVTRVYSDTPALLSPDATAGIAVDWRATEFLNLALEARWTDEARLTNTDDPRLSTPSLAVVDLAAVLELGRWLKVGDPRLRLRVINALDEDRAWPSGYGYPYLVRESSGAETLEGQAYYYPLATRHAYASLEFRF